MTLAHLFHLLFPEFAVLFSSCFFWKHFCFPLSLLMFNFSVIPKAVIFLVVFEIVGCGLSDSVEPLRKWGNRNFLITFVQEPESLSSLVSCHGRCPSVGPPFACTGVALHQPALLKRDLGRFPRPLYKRLWKTEHFQLGDTRDALWGRDHWGAAAKGSHHGTPRALTCERTQSLTRSVPFHPVDP